MKSSALTLEAKDLHTQVDNLAEETQKATAGEGNMSAAVRGRKVAQAMIRELKQTRQALLPYTKTRLAIPEPQILPTEPTPPTSPEISE